VATTRRRSFRPRCSCRTNATPSIVRGTYAYAYACACAQDDSYHHALLRVHVMHKSQLWVPTEVRAQGQLRSVSPPQLAPHGGHRYVCADPARVSMSVSGRARAYLTSLSFSLLLAPLGQCPHCTRTYPFLCAARYTSSCYVTLWMLTQGEGIARSGCCPSWRTRSSSRWCSRMPAVRCRPACVQDHSRRHRCLH
jgi:hypothetical protein